MRQQLGLVTKNNAEMPLKHHWGQKFCFLRLTLIQNGPSSSTASKQLSSVNTCNRFNGTAWCSETPLQEFPDSAIVIYLSPAVVHFLLYTHCEATSYGQSWQRRVLWTTRQHWLHKKITRTAAEAINTHYQTTLPSSFKLMASLGWFGPQWLQVMEFMHKTHDKFLMQLTEWRSWPM